MKTIDKLLATLRHIKFAQWFVVALIVTLVFVFGIMGFAYRPPQLATFDAKFVPGTKLTLSNLQSQCPRGDAIAPGVISTKVSGIVPLTPFGRPLDLILPMRAEVFQTLADKLGNPCPNCKIIELSNRTLELDFSQSPTALLSGEGSQELQLNRLVSGDLEIRAYASTAATVNGQPLLTFRVLPANANVVLKADQQDIGEFPINASLDTATVRLDPITDSKIEGKLDLLYPVTLTAKEFDFHAEICAQQLEVEDTPEAVLTLGPVVQKIGWGERLKLAFDTNDFVRATIERDRLSLNARDCENPGKPWPISRTAGKPCVIHAIYNDVVDLVPYWFSLWDDWAKGLWSTFAIGTGSATFLQILKRFRLWPNFKE